MNLRKNLLRLLMPAVVMLLFSGLLLAEMLGISIEARGSSIALLDNVGAFAPAWESQPARMLVVYNSENTLETAFADTLSDTLRELHLPSRRADVAAEPLPDLNAYDTVLYCSQSLLPLENHVGRLTAWIQNGGHFGLMMTPRDDSGFRILYRKLGIIEYGREYQNYTSLRYVSDLLPLWDDSIYHEDHTLTDYALAVRLDKDCKVHIMSGGELGIPLLWERPVGQGRVVVLNTTLMVNRGGRGFALSALSALEDMLVYPIINAAMVFIDDFPAPQPEGFNERLRQQFGYNIQGFFRNHWWPDMKQLAWDFGLRYTGLLIETYNDNVTGPFTAHGVDDSLLKYYAAELLHSGGEMGLHGYNHMPLALPGFDYSGAGYTPWPSTLHMAKALQELYRYGKTLYINADYQTYVAPSNFLSDIGRQTLVKTLPNIKVIAGLYLREIGVNALVQEFDEEADGSINVPRITSGFETDDYMDFVAAQELVLHGVYSHFIHPDDVLDAERGARLGWMELFADFRARIAKIAATYPQLRFLTAAEGAAAVQRYHRLSVFQEADETGMTLTLDAFYDEAWLALRTRTAVASVTGGELFQIANGMYWIRADQSVLRITWEAAP